ncbi:MAG: hypothetical protein AAF502_11115 [Bacteroidota bacterium]
MSKLPVIFIPGIQGTTLSNTNEKDFKTVFSGFKKYFKRIRDIGLKRDGFSDQKLDFLINPSDVEDLAYSEIIDMLRGNGFKVFIFGYDWRLSNQTNAHKLLAFVKRLGKKFGNTKKFYFLTHSMGGLVLSSFIKMLHQNNEVETYIDKTIFCNPPFLGSLEAAYNLVVGRSFFFNSSDDFRKVARTFPSIYELSGVYKNSFKFKDQSLVNDFFNFKSYWQHELSPSTTRAKAKNSLMEFRFKELKKIRNDKHNSIFDFGKMDKRILKKLIVLVGSNEKTLETLPIKDTCSNGRIKNYFNFDEAHYSQEGDGTVHHNSSTVFKDSIVTIDIASKPIETRWNSHLIMNDWHAFFLNNGRVQNIIKRFFECDEATLQKVNGTSDWFQSLGGSIKQI